MSPCEGNDQQGSWLVGCFKVQLHSSVLDLQQIVIMGVSSELNEILPAGSLQLSLASCLEAAAVLTILCLRAVPYGHRKLSAYSACSQYKC